MKSKLWLVFAIVTTLFWGVWGALIDIPRQAGFPQTLGYCVWALTMIPPALVALKIIDWDLEYDSRSIGLGSAVGFLGAGGQLILFEALRLGPAYIIFPLISLSPVVTILLSLWLLQENTTVKGWVGIVLALAAIFLLSYEEPAAGVVSGGYLWMGLALLVFLAWGIQAYVIKFANETMEAESIFFYMMVTALLLIPIAVAMTDFSQEINWGLSGPYAAAGIQVLNAVGALCLVYAFRYGQAIIVSPLTNAVAPVITVGISLTIYAVDPFDIPYKLTGIVVALTATFLMAIEEETEEAVAEELEAKEVLP
jgi:drug/metabolite transporter (DMT)-like permease